MKYIKVPKGKLYIDNWGEDFDKQMPDKSKIILDKQQVGVGITYHYCNNKMPILLISPRIELILSKMNNERLYGKLFYYHTDLKDKSASVIAQMKDYLHKSSLFGGNIVPKILLCYDSISIVLSVLEDLGLTNKFTAIVDEVQNLIEDTSFKGSVDLNLVYQLANLKMKTIFVSATTLSDLFITTVPEFKDVAQVKLSFDESDLRSVIVHQQKLSDKVSIDSMIGSIIKKYRENKYFSSKIIDGNPVFSTEGYFFVNSVALICRVIKKMRLTPEDTRVIVGVGDSNLYRLSRVGFKPEHFPNELEYKTKNKTFTFITKTAFAGADCYSDNGSIFIFSDPEVDCLAADISTSVVQCIGRIRTLDNPFRDEAYFYYKTYDKSTEQEELRIKAKKAKTEELLKNGAFASNEEKEALIAYQAKNHYKNTYLDVVFDKNVGQKLVFNNLAYANDLRGLQCYKEQYNRSYTVVASLIGNNFKIGNHKEALKENLLANFLKDKNFVRRMSLIVKTIEANPETMKNFLESSSVPENIKEYLIELGIDRIKALSYKEKDLARELASKKIESQIAEKMKEVFSDELGFRYNNLSVKVLIQKIYKDLNIDRKAKANEIEKYIPTVKKWRKGNTTGYYLIGKKQIKLVDFLAAMNQQN